MKKNRSKEHTDVNHIDGNKLNNKIWNLEWCTHKENIKHAWDNNLHPIYVGEESSHHKFTESQIETVCDMLSKNFLVSDISKTTGVSKDMIKKILTRKNWTHISSKYSFSNRNRLHGNTYKYI